MTTETPLTKDEEHGPDLGATSTLKLYAKFKTTSHFAKREYLLYTFDNFVADVGGYLGLLLGHRYGHVKLLLLI